MPDLASFSSLPYLQVFAGAVVLLGGIWMMVQAQRDKARVPAPAEMPQGVQMFFNGPLIQALNCIRDTNELLRHIDHHLANMRQTMNEAAEQTRRVRDELAKQTEKSTEITRDQTEKHAELMGRLESRADEILRELKNRRDR